MKKDVVASMEPIGALVYVDGWRQGHVVRATLSGTYFFKGPHYAIEFIDDGSVGIVEYDRVYTKPRRIAK